VTGHWESTGIRQRIDADKLPDTPEYNPISQEHCWIIIVTYRYNPDVAEPILDRDIMLFGPRVGCLFCEKPYSHLLRHRRCPGEPK